MSGTSGGQPVGNSGQPVGTSGQPVGNSGEPVSNSGQPVGNSGQSVGNSGQPVDVSWGDFAGLKNRLSTADGGRRGADLLLHAGGILRCRSAGLGRAAKEKSGGDEDGAVTAPLTPNLRAYSAPLFLHTALHPPCIQVRVATRKIPESRANGRRTGRARPNHICSGSERKREEALGHRQYRQEGYLHRYMGFEQCKVWFPPVQTFRITGGLGEFPPKEATASGDGKIASGRTASVRGDPAKVKEPVDKPRRKASSENLARLSAAEGRHTSSAVVEDNPPDGGTVIQEDSSSLLGLFAEGSVIAATAKHRQNGLPDGGRGLSSRSSGGSKGRPRGAKRQKAWGLGGRNIPLKKLGRSYTKRCPSLPKGDRGSGGRKERLQSSPRLESFLPYTLDRPVSTLGAFAFTCN